MADALDTGEHLVVQAGTGTGKSMAYLVPAIDAAVSGNGPVVVSTANKALQHQLIKRDLPTLVNALGGDLARPVSFALLKGRNNYICKDKLAVSDEEAAKRDLLNVDRWVSGKMTGDRADLKIAVPDRLWSEFSVSAAECPGAANCPSGNECFSELARTAAATADVVVTNHAMLAIDASTDAAVLPTHKLLVVDEAHELVEQITAARTADLSAVSLNATATLLKRLPPSTSYGFFELSVERFLAAVRAISGENSALVDDLVPEQAAQLSELYLSCVSLLENSTSAWETATSDSATGGAAPAVRHKAIAALDHIRDTAGRVVEACGAALPARSDAVWIHREWDRQPVLRVAPMSVAAALRGGLFAATKTTVLTSATLKLGGSFDAMARKWGLDGETPFRKLDVGTPFHYPSSGHLYLAAHLPPPGARDPRSEAERLDGMAALIDAAGGRTLALFASNRALAAAVGEMRGRFGEERILSQGDGDLDRLVREFAANPETSLFGVASLWQGVDVPGQSLSLVVIDKIPFPYVGDPLLEARARAIAAAGGDWFTELSADPAAVRLAQGVGRLKRAVDDRGVVAVLDSRIAKNGYGDYLLSSLPDFPQTSDTPAVLEYLRSLRLG